MPRRPRIQYEGAIYHVMGRGNNGRPIVCSNKDRELWYQILARYASLHNVKIYAHTLMTNHYHILLETPFPNLSVFMHDFSTIYVQNFKKNRKHRGYLYQDRFKSILVQRQHYFLTVFRYIHLNPIRAGLIQRLEDYRWTSYGDYLGCYEPLVTLPMDWARSEFGEPFAEKFRSFHKKTEEEKELLDPEYIRGLPYYGDKKFGGLIKRRLDRRRKSRESKGVKMSINEFEKRLKKETGFCARDVFQDSRGAATIWKARIITLGRKLTNAGYAILGEKWNVKPSCLAKQYSRYTGLCEKKEMVNLKKICKRIID